MGDEAAERDEIEPASLETSVANLLEEARMLLPGTQMLFGFQLIVVFNQTFQDWLAPREQFLQLVAMLLTAVAIAFLLVVAVALLALIVALWYVGPRREAARRE